MSSWKKLSEKYIHQNPFFKLRKDEVIRPDGANSHYWVIEKTGAVFIVPQNAQGEICLIKQFRYPTQTWSWEIPAGAIDPGETALEAAKRELWEETSLQADSYEKVGSFPIGPGLSTNIAQVYLAKNLTKCMGNRQQEEGIVDCQFFPLDVIKKMIRSREIIDGPSLATLALVFWK